MNGSAVTVTYILESLRRQMDDSGVLFFDLFTTDFERFQYYNQKKNHNRELQKTGDIKKAKTAC